jgi:hypothetical protein
MRERLATTKLTATGESWPTIGKIHTTIEESSPTKTHVTTTRDRRCDHRELTHTTTAMWIGRGCKEEDVMESRGAVP